METAAQIREASGFPQLTDLGKRIEMLRISRGLSKQYLAQYAGISRQQLWRVITGKSELTGALRARLAEALNVSTLEFDGPVAAARSIGDRPLDLRAPVQFPVYVADSGAIARTLATLPAGDTGRSLKRRLLDALEDMAMSGGCSLDARFFELRRRVLAGEL